MYTYSTGTLNKGININDGSTTLRSVTLLSRGIFFELRIEIDIGLCCHAAVFIPSQRGGLEPGGLFIRVGLGPHERVPKKKGSLLGTQHESSLLLRKKRSERGLCNRA